jgi:hypothetical protein
MAAATVSDRKDISSLMMPVIRRYALSLQTAKGRELTEGIKTLLPYVLSRLSDVKLSGGDGPPLRLVLYMPTPDVEPEYTPPTQGGK